MPNLHLSIDPEKLPFLLMVLAFQFLCIGLMLLAFAVWRRERQTRRLIIPIIHDLRTALYGTNSTKTGDCFCQETARIRDFDGDHSPACKAAQLAVARANRFLS